MVVMNQGQDLGGYGCEVREAAPFGFGGDAVNEEGQRSWNVVALRCGRSIMMIE